MQGYSCGALSVASVDDARKVNKHLRNHPGLRAEAFKGTLPGLVKLARFPGDERGYRARFDSDVRKYPEEKPGG